VTHLFPVPDPVTPDWLSAALGPSGAVGRGAVEAVEWEPTGAFNSATVRLRVRYSADVPAGAPTRLILKRNIGEGWARAAGADEVRFYTLVASLADHPPVTVAWCGCRRRGRSHPPRRAAAPDGALSRRP
jgi:hypothetical protein